MALKVFDNYQGNSIKINGVCYKFVGETTSSVNTLPSEIGGAYDNCLECVLESSSSSEEYSESSSSSEKYSESSSSSENITEKGVVDNSIQVVDNGIIVINT
jgi:hypothetical protein